MPAPEILYVPEMSQDSRVRVYRSNRVRVCQDGLAGPETFDGMEVDCYLLVTERFLLFCDTLIRPEDMATLTGMLPGELLRRPALIMNSHADWDHAWGNSYFTGEHAAPIIGHEHCRERMESDEDRTFLASYQKSYPNHFHTVVLTPPTITFHDKLSLYGGDLALELFSAPGHCEDHIAAWLPELQLLLAFDAVETPIPLLKNAASAQNMFTTLERFLSLHPQRVLCSHGRTTSPAIIQANLTYFREIERRCRTVLARHHPTETELEHASTLIGYPLDEVVTQAASAIEIPEPVDRDFYSWAHDANARYIMQWLMS